MCVAHAVGIVFLHADVAQLVEHHLAKVRVAGSNPVVRSTRKPPEQGVFVVFGVVTAVSLPVSAGPVNQASFLAQKNLGNVS